MDTSPGTPLYNLPLLGEGTVQVESLTSYIVRLARAHYLRPRDLIRRVAGVGRPEIVALCYARFFSRYAITVNGLGKYARLFADRFSELTGNPNLAHATLLPWYKLLAPNGSALLAPHPRWCGRCWLEDVRNGNSPYHRLAWTIALEQYCVRHEMLLEERCPSCGRAQPALPRYADLVHCDRCYQPLVSHLGPITPPNKRHRQESFSTEQAIEDLLALNAIVDPETTHGQLVGSLNRAVTNLANGNRAAFCAAVGLQSRALNGWLSKGEHVSLKLLLHLRLLLGLKPTFTFGDVNLGKWQSSHPACQNQGPRRKYHSPKDRAQAKKLLVQALATPEEARSLSAIARELGVSRGYLSYWHPQLVRPLVEIRRLAARERSMLRTQSHQDVIRAAIRQALDLGLEPGRKWVESAARKEGFSLMDADIFRVYQGLRCGRAALNLPAATPF